MARLLIGNFKGQQGLQGEKGDDGVIDSNSVIDFEDYTENTPPSPDTALRNILTGHSISDLLSNIKAFLKNALTTDKIANNLATTDTTMVLGAAMGKQLGDSVNTLNTNLTWKLLGQVSMNIDINLPTNYNELLLIANSTGNPSDNFQLNVPKIDLVADQKRFLHGGFWNSGATFGIAVYVSLTKAKMGDDWINGSPVATGFLRVYYR